MTQMIKKIKLILTFWDLNFSAFEFLRLKFSKKNWKISRKCKLNEI